MGATKSKRNKGAELQTQLEMSESFTFRPDVSASGFFIMTKLLHNLFICSPTRFIFKLLPNFYTQSFILGGCSVIKSTFAE